MKASQNYNIRWQIKVEERIKHVEDMLMNHVISRLDRIDKRFDKLDKRDWKIIFTILGILGTLSVALILALLKIM